MEEESIKGLGFGRFACLGFIVCCLLFGIWGLAASRVWGLLFVVCCLLFVVCCLGFGVGGFKPTEPTKPIEPFEPFEPIELSKPTEPTKLIEPLKPIEPFKQPTSTHNSFQ